MIKVDGGDHNVDKEMIDLEFDDTEQQSCANGM